jgi:hypothetical protein
LSTRDWVMFQRLPQKSARLVAASGS